MWDISDMEGNEAVGRLAAKGTERELGSCEIDLRIPVGTMTTG